MTWIPAQSLRVGMRTGGGLIVSAIDRRNGMAYVTFDGMHGAKPTRQIAYLPGQEFDIEEEGSQVAQKVSILVESDLSSKPDAETVYFSLDGTAYEIDLTEDEQSKMRGAFAKYVGAARKAKGAAKRASAPRGSQVTTGPSLTDVREWAKANGIEVSDRGRVAKTVLEQYNAAH